MDDSRLIIALILAVVILAGVGIVELIRWIF